MKALLRTRCGCQREVEVTFPPPPDILVPLKTDPWKHSFLRLASEIPPTGPHAPLRRFLRTSERYNSRDVAYYEESD